MTTWHILRCMTMRERWLANELRRGLGLKTYVPVEKVVATLRARRIERIRPLMPGYVFIGSPYGIPWSDVKATRHVIDYLKVDDETPASVSDAEVERIRDLEQMHNAALHDRRVFRAGDRVRAKDGPFASMDVLLRSVRGSQATIEVHMLGSLRTAQVKLDQLEKVA